MSAVTAPVRLARPGVRRVSVQAAMQWAAAIAILGIVLAALAFHLAGGTWFVVQTPSMGTTAPVGTLLIDQPTRFSDLRVGDIVTFHPPTAPSEVYTHRLVQHVGDGFRTRGDINGADDGWVIHEHDLIGRVAVILPALGWLVRGLPILIAGVLFTVLSTRWPRSAYRSTARLVGGCVTAALAAAWLHPFAGMVLLQTAVEHRTIVATVVSTGLLPIRVTAHGGASTHLDPGQVGLLRVTCVPSGHRIAVSSALDLPWWGWALLAAVCLTPLLLSALQLARHGLLLARRRSLHRAGG